MLDASRSFYFFMTLNFCVVTCQKRTMFLFLFWILLTRSMHSCLLTFLPKLLKTERNPQSRAILSSVSKLFSEEGCSCVAFLVMVLLPSSLPSVNADLPECCSLSFEGWLCHKASSSGGSCPHARDSWMETVEWHVCGTYSLPYEVLQSTQGNTVLYWEDGEEK